mgnify:CR=1 FL=1
MSSNEESSQLDIKTIFENIKKDNSLIAKLDINEILSKVEKSEYLEGKTINDILEEKITILNGLDITTIEQKNMLDKLLDYRYIKNIYELHKGKHIRWIKYGVTPIKLDRGAILSDIKFTNTGTILQCRRYDQKIYQIKMDDHIIFQKMNNEELLLLTIYENIQKGKI